MSEEKVHEMSYADYLRPLVNTLTNSIAKFQEEADGYNEFDIYNALALTITVIAASGDDEKRNIVHEQSVRISQKMVEAGLIEAGRLEEEGHEVYVPSLVIGASRSVTRINEIIESNLVEDEPSE